MTSVHGISVTGGSFPAQVWRLFMSSAIGGLDDVGFPEPKDWPEWTDFKRGQYARSFGYYPGSGGGSSDETTTESTPSETTPAQTGTVPDAPPASSHTNPPPRAAPPPSTPAPPPETTPPPTTAGPE
jgi:membrane peptidoglycan carboxypeptidase